MIAARPSQLASQLARSAYAAVDIIIGIPPHIIMHGMPIAIMFCIIDMRSFIMSI